jgi:hypothetical protein
VNLYIGLIPFVAANATQLGRRLSEIVNHPDNGSLCVDFPRIRKAYGTQATAIETVRMRQQKMLNEPTYAALAVVLGTSSHNSFVYGVTTMNVKRPPVLGSKAGPHMAIWLDSTRPSALRNIGRVLLEERVEWLTRYPNFYGYPWAVVRPGNKGSWAVWAYTGPDLTLTFESVGRLRSYRKLDGVATQRQLFVATEPIEALRQRHSA